MFCFKIYNTQVAQKIIRNLSSAKNSLRHTITAPYNWSIDRIRSEGYCGNVRNLNTEVEKKKSSFSIEMEMA